MIGKKLPLSEEIMRQAFVAELMTMGVTEGRAGERLHDLTYREVLNLVTTERIKRDYE